MPTNRFTWTLRLGSDYATFLRQVQERVAGQVMSRTDSVHRERELTQNSEELYRLWAAWTNMPLRAQASVTFAGHISTVGFPRRQHYILRGQPRTAARDRL